MRKRFGILITLVMVAIMAIPMAAPLVAYAAQGPATDTVVFKKVAVDLASQAIKSGDIDYYIYALRPSQAIALAGDADLKLAYAPAGLVDIILNPAPMPAGKLNPLSIKEVRFALNYIMDRDYVVNQVYKGFAAPMVTFLSSFDPDYVTIYDIVAKYEFKYDLTIADAAVTKAMTAAGAKKVDNKWTYNGSPVSLKFLIRTEDERREIGDTFASNLEKLGFTIERQYMTFGQAIPILYGTDPAQHQWDLYTEGWGKSVPDKYDAGTINQFGAPWQTYMPGWQEAGFWQYENARADVLGKKLLLGEFKSKAERDSIYKELTEIVINESIRVWAATRKDIHPYTKTLMGTTNDLGTGLRSPFNLREVNIPGKTTVNVGNLWVWTEGTVYNPVGGHDDVYSVDIWRGVYDPFMWRHPFTGLPMPFRAGYDVTTAGPDGKMDVPSDSFLWDVKDKAWKPIGTGVKATSKVTFDMSKYIGTKWHDGQTIGWEDILYGIYQQWEIGYDKDKSSLESQTAASTKDALDKFKGFKIDGNKLVVYVDFWHFSSDYIADFANFLDEGLPMAHMPWEILAAMDKVVFTDKTAAYSQTAADNYGVPWLSLVLEDHANLVKDALAGYKAAGTTLSNVFQIGATSYMTAAKAQARYDAAISWITTHKNALISDGPYYLNTFDAASQYAELKAVRDATYPFVKGKWIYGDPTAPEIVRMGIPTVIPSQDASIVVDVSGLPPMGAKYLIKHPITGEILKIGDATSITASRFVVELPAAFTKTLKAGLYEVTVAAYSDQVAFVSSEKAFFNVLDIPKTDLTGVTSDISTLKSGLTSIDASVKGVTTKVDALGTDLNSKITAVNTNLGTKLDASNKQLTDAVSALASTQTTVMVLIALVALIGVANIVLLMRKQ